ncbi:methylmalonyl-CoA mutase family protein [Spirosoma arcticum]
MQNHSPTNPSEGHFVPEKRKRYFYGYIVINHSMDSFSRTNFPPADKSDWLAQVQKELKDPAASQSLRWHTGEGFIAEPYYTADDLPEGPLPNVQKQTAGWLNTPIYSLTDDAQADNSTLRDALTRGADALVINMPDAPGTGDAAIQRLSRVLNGIKLSDTPIFFRTDTADAATLITALKTVAPYQLKGGLLTNMGIHTATITRLTADSPQFRTVCASSHAFHNAGATATQELAFTLATLADAYDSLTDAGLTIDQLIPKTTLSVSVGTSYFMEIAKLRALRVLFRRFITHYSSLINHSLIIHAQTSAFYDAAATPYTNLLRATTEAMAAVVGGCDALTVRPYDAVLGQQAADSDREFAHRIARNVSVLLKEESYFDKVADPSAGSYYIETLTHELAETAWALFLDVEQRGGFAKAFTSGFIADEIERAYQAKVDAVQNGKVLVGVTKFRHDETPDQTCNVFRDLTGLLPNRRLAEEFE